MGTNITTSAVFGSLPTNRPDDLDDAYMDGGPYPLWPILQELANRSDFFQRVIYGLLVESGKLIVTGTANTGVIGVTVGMIEAIALKDTAPDPDVWRVQSVPETALNIGGTVLANNTWYNIYAYISGGAVTYEVSTTARNASGIWKLGSADTHRFIACFKTGNTGIPLPMVKYGNHYVFATEQLITTGAVVASVSNANLAIGTALPADARSFRARVDIQVTGTPSIGVRSPGGGADVGSNTDLVELFADNNGVRYSALIGGGESATLSLYIQSFDL